MNFNELKKIFENETSFIEKYDDFKRGDVPGGLIIYSNQEKKIDDDITIKVVCHGRTGWDNTIDIIPTSKKAKAARIAVRRDCIRNVPKEIFDRSVKTQFGWELVQYLNNRPEFIKELLDVESRPEVNLSGNLSNDRFYDWVIFNKLSNNLWLLGLSGPRQESLLTILYGNWRSKPSIKEILWKKYVIR